MALTRPATGSWTYEDLLALPDDGRRWEIVEGELHEMPAPSWAHAVIIANLIAAWFRVVPMNGAARVVAASPPTRVLRYIFSSHGPLWVQATDLATHYARDRAVLPQSTSPAALSRGQSCRRKQAHVERDQ